MSSNRFIGSGGWDKDVFGVPFCPLQVVPVLLFPWVEFVPMGRGRSFAFQLFELCVGGCPGFRPLLNVE